MLKGVESQHDPLLLCNNWYKLHIQDVNTDNFL